MRIDRRDLMMGVTALAAGGIVSSSNSKEADVMYGLIGKMTAAPGQRAALAEVLLSGVAGMPGCLSYVVANDPTNTDLLWITEVWDSREAHATSLSLPSVREAITRGRPMIAGMEAVTETVPLGGHGLVQR